MKKFMFSVIVVVALFSAMCPSWAQENAVPGDAIEAYARDGYLPGTRVPRKEIVVPVATPVEVPQATATPQKVEVSGEVKLIPATEETRVIVRERVRTRTRPEEATAPAAKPATTAAPKQPQKNETPPVAPATNKMPVAPAEGRQGMNPLSIVLLSILGAGLLGAIGYLLATRWDQQGVVAAIGAATNRLQGAERLVASGTGGRFDLRVEPANATPAVIPPAVAPVVPPAPAPPVQVTISPTFNVGGGTPVPRQRQQQSQTP